MTRVNDPSQYNGFRCFPKENFTHSAFCFNLTYSLETARKVKNETEFTFSLSIQAIHLCRYPPKWHFIPSTKQNKSWTAGKDNFLSLPLSSLDGWMFIFFLFHLQTKSINSNLTTAVSQIIQSFSFFPPFIVFGVPTLPVLCSLFSFRLTFTLGKVNYLFGFLIHRQKGSIGTIVTARFSR